MNDSAKQSLIERYLAAYNAFDIDGMLALLSPDVRFENHSGNALTASTDGIDAFRQLAEQSRSLFSEREQRVTAWRFGADTTTVDIDYRGVLAVDVPDGPSAGSTLELKGRSEFAFAAGKIIRIIDRS